MKKDKLRKIFGGLLCAALAMGTVAVFASRQNRNLAVFAPRTPEQTVVIDAGHGGEDGGAVSKTGVAESGINLAIARKLDHLLALYGVNTKLIREEDVSLHGPEDVTLRQMKVADLHRRVALIEETKRPVLISIHQNMFENPKYHGAQVFYGREAASRPFAEFTQQCLRELLDPENTRVATKIPDFVYLMKHITCPAILVECGFLSNGAEAHKLQTDRYQSQIATVLAGAYLSYCPDGENGEGALENEG